MKNENNKTEILTDFGLTQREAKIYNALLYRKTATMKELKKLSDVAQNKIYDIVANMVNNGLIIQNGSGKVRTYRISNPKDSLKPLLNKHRESLKSFEDFYEECLELYQNGISELQPHEFIEVIHGNENVHRKYLEVLNSAKTEILSITKPPYASHSKELFEIQYAAYYKFVARGGKDRGIFEMCDDPDDRILFMIEDSHQKNENFRIGYNLPPKMFIFDRTVLLTMNIDKYSKLSEFTSTVIRDKTTVDFYYEMFDSLWEKSLTYEQWKETLDKPFKSVSMDDL